jgi:sortase A
MASFPHPHLARGGPNRRAHFPTRHCEEPKATKQSSRAPILLVIAIAGALLFGDGIYIPAQALLSQILLARAFDPTLATGRATRPWAWADTVPVARIEVKRLNASAIVLAGSSGQALAFGPGHVETTPRAGERGTAVYSAHRDTHFRFVRDIVIGDEIAVTRSDGRTFTYRADATSVVRFDASGIDPYADDHALVLSTCWPFDSITPGPLRYVLHAVMVSPEVLAQPILVMAGLDPAIPIRDAVPSQAGSPGQAR